MHGCTKVSSACTNCYAEVMARRLQGNHIKSYENGFKPTLNPDVLKDPYKWKKPSMVFVCSMGDLFHRDVPCDYIDQVMQVIRENPQHTFQILTKRAERMAKYFMGGASEGVPQNAWLVSPVRASITMTASTGSDGLRKHPSASSVVSL